MKLDLKQIKSSIKLFICFIVSVACLFFCVLTVGQPQIVDSLIDQILGHTIELANVYRGSEQQKLAFLNDNFCINGSLEALTLNAQDNVTESVLVDSLNRDCVVVLDYLNRDTAKVVE